MKLSELVKLACSLRDENEMENDPDVYIWDGEYGELCDIDVVYVPEQFRARGRCHIGMKSASRSCTRAGK